MNDKKYNIKGMTDKGRELLAWMGNSFEINGGAWLDEKNVHNLTDQAIDEIADKLRTMKNLPPDKQKDKELVLEELGIKPTNISKSNFINTVMDWAN